MVSQCHRHPRLSEWCHEWWWCHWVWSDWCHKWHNASCQWCWCHNSDLGLGLTATVPLGWKTWVSLSVWSWTVSLTVTLLIVTLFHKVVCTHELTACMLQSMCYVYKHAWCLARKIAGTIYLPPRNATALEFAQNAPSRRAALLKYSDTILAEIPYYFAPRRWFSLYSEYHLCR